MFSPDMLAAAQKMMANMSPEQMSQIAGMASKMNPDMLKGISGGNAGMPMPTAEQLKEAQEKMKGMNADEMKDIFATASNKMAGQNSYMVNGATVLKNEGNDKVRAGDHQGAIEIFERALGNLETVPVPDASVISLAQSIRLNLALCHLKLSEYTSCETVCDKILTSDPKSVKALYRRGVARRELGRVPEAAKDLKMSMLLAGQKDETINAEYERTLHLVSDPEELETLDNVTVADLESVPVEAVPHVATASNLAKAKEIIETNPDVIDRMGDVFSQLDDNQLDGLLSMSAAGSGVGDIPDLSAMKDILKNKDFMKSMTEMMKNMDPSVLEAMRPGSSSSSSSAGPPDLSQMMKDPNMLKSVETMIESVPDSMLEEMLTSQVGQGKALPSFVTGARMKWVVKRIMGLVRIWLVIKRMFAIILSRNGKIVIAILVVVYGVYVQYGHMRAGKPEEREEKNSP